LSSPNARSTWYWQDGTFAVSVLLSPGARSNVTCQKYFWLLVDMSGISYDASVIRYEQSFELFETTAVIVSMKCPLTSLRLYTQDDGTVGVGAGVTGIGVGVTTGLQLPATVYESVPWLLPLATKVKVPESGWFPVPTRPPMISLGPSVPRQICAPLSRT
jgi:hypothetical protein